MKACDKCPHFDALGAIVTDWHEHDEYLRAMHESSLAFMKRKA